MNKCPNCKSQDVNLIDSNENYTYSSPEFKTECLVWEQWECNECEAISDIEDETITVLVPTGVNENRIKFRVSTDWERKFSEL